MGPTTAQIWWSTVGPRRPEPVASGLRIERDVADLVDDLQMAIRRFGASGIPHPSERARPMGVGGDGPHRYESTDRGRFVTDIIG